MTPFKKGDRVVYSPPEGVTSRSVCLELVGKQGLVAHSDDSVTMVEFDHSLMGGVVGVLTCNLKALEVVKEPLEELLEAHRRYNAAEKAYKEAEIEMGKANALCQLKQREFNKWLREEATK